MLSDRVGIHDTEHLRREHIHADDNGTIWIYKPQEKFACLAIEYGVPIDVLAKILGHSSTNMARHYAKFSEQSLLF